LFSFGKRSFGDLSAREVLALAIGAEEEDARRYRDMADRVMDNFPHSAKVLDAMAREEDEHRRRLIDMFKQKFGDHIPVVRREDVSGFVRHPPIWSMKAVTIDGFQRDVATLELEAQRFYLKAAERASDPDVRKLLGDLAAMEAQHERTAERLEETFLKDDDKREEAKTERRMFVMQIVQPGLAGLIDGSISTLAPIFAAAFATQNPFSAFLVGMAASIGAGISMGLTEALSDDGVITGRGRPWIRGAVCGLMTAVGGLGHTLPFLIPHFWTAIGVAAVVVAAELAVISWVRWRYMETRFTSAIGQVVLGGILVLITGILIGSA
jgi:rubrerythrin